MVQKLMLAGVMLVACGKNQDDTKAGSGPTVTISTTDEYVAKRQEYAAKLFAIVDAGGNDCDKLATAFRKLAVDERAVIVALKAYDSKDAAAETTYKSHDAALEPERTKKASAMHHACGAHTVFLDSMKQLF